VAMLFLVLFVSRRFGAEQVPDDPARGGSGGLMPTMRRPLPPTSKLNPDLTRSCDSC